MTVLLPDEDVRNAYAEVRDQVIRLLSDLTEADADLPVPACPNWTVRNLVAHFAGVPDDILSGRMEGVGSDAWTQAQVDRHSTTPLADLRALLAAQAASFDPVLLVIPAPVNSQLVMDAVTHEHDLRGAIDRPGNDNSLAVRVGVAWLLQAGIVSTEVVGQIESAGAAPFAVLRALSGRTSQRRMNELGLPGDAINKALQHALIGPPPLD